MNKVIIQVGNRIRGGRAEVSLRRRNKVNASS